MSPDPFGYGDGLNFFAYVGNDPVNYTDPSGRFSEEHQATNKPHTGPIVPSSFNNGVPVIKIPGNASSGDILSSALGGGSAKGAVTLLRVGKKADKAEATGGIYLLRDASTGKVRRTGKTNTLARRENEHGRPKETKDLDFEIDRRIDSEPARRGREQRLYDLYPEADLNKRRPISPLNPKRDFYLEEGDKYR